MLITFTTQWLNNPSCADVILDLIFTFKWEDKCYLQEKGSVATQATRENKYLTLSKIVLGKQTTEEKYYICNIYTSTVVSYK